jgi:hypothetical protein
MIRSGVSPKHNGEASIVNGENTGIARTSRDGHRPKERTVRFSARSLGIDKSQESFEEFADCADYAGRKVGH